MFNKNHIIQYLQARHLSDGGYFFARVTPSSALDTMCAVETLKLLNSKQIPISEIMRFFKNEDKEGNLKCISSLFFAVQTYKALKIDISEFKKYSPFILENTTNKNIFKKKKFKAKAETKFLLSDNSVNTLYLDLVEGEVKDLYYLTFLCKNFNINEANQNIIDFILSLENTDGGFGNIKGSELSTTYYALKILKKLNYPLVKLKKTINFLKRQIERANYLEEYFWAVESFILLKISIPRQSSLLSFLIACQKGNGGFARSQFIGIANIEQTYQAVTILKHLEKYDLPLFE
ncbi:hypothetical protein GYA19_01395 [Candidatus Beckwithbacteria bacterium]|nr:hypothetical protein [Candidatus Beckwithbacteria bacterium]